MNNSEKFESKVSLFYSRDKNSGPNSLREKIVDEVEKIFLQEKNNILTIAKKIDIDEIKA